MFPAEDTLCLLGHAKKSLEPSSIQTTACGHSDHKSKQGLADLLEHYVVVSTDKAVIQYAIWCNNLHQLIGI